MIIRGLDKILGLIFFFTALIYGVGGFMKMDLLAYIIPKRFELIFYVAILGSVVLKVLLLLFKRKKIKKLRR